jgi:hypothetical protein
MSRAYPSTAETSADAQPPQAAGEDTTKLVLPSAAVDLRKCSVTFTDHRGARHTVEVSAASLYEAAALALRELKRCDWVEPVGPAARLEVEARQAATRHEVTLLQVQRWCESTAVTPEERLRKERVKALLG